MNRPLKLTKLNRKLKRNSTRRDIKLGSNLKFTDTPFQTLITTIYLLKVLEEIKIQSRSKFRMTIINKSLMSFRFWTNRSNLSWYLVSLFLRMGQTRMNLHYRDTITNSRTKFVRRPEKSTSKLTKYQPLRKELLF
jgi:hypothetical protein